MFLYTLTVQHIYFLQNIQKSHTKTFSNSCPTYFFVSLLNYCDIADRTFLFALVIHQILIRNLLSQLNKVRGKNLPKNTFRMHSFFPYFPTSLISFSSDIKFPYHQYIFIISILVPKLQMWFSENFLSILLLFSVGVRNNYCR